MSSNVRLIMHLILHDIGKDGEIVYEKMTLFATPYGSVSGLQHTPIRFRWAWPAWLRSILRLIIQKAAPKLNAAFLKLNSENRLKYILKEYKKNAHKKRCMALGMCLISLSI
jgi:hypothetical protein